MTHLYSGQKMTFGTSAHLEARWAFALTAEVRAAIAPLAEVLGATNEEIDFYASRQFSNFELEELVVWKDRVGAVTENSTTATSAKKFWAAQALAVPVFSREPLSAEPSDDVAKRLLRVGADSFYEAGFPQFEKLRSVCVELVTWLSNQNWPRVVLVESPLGNCVPTAVLHSLANQAGIETEIVIWNSPRNDRAGSGRTVLDSARSLSSVVGDKDLLIFADDVITGTRFVKTFDALSREFPGRVLPIAMTFRDAGKPEFAQNQHSRVRKRVRIAGEALGYSNTHVDFPVLPPFRIDDAAPIRWESPVIWGETDLVAGKRKVNLIFNLIDHLFFTLQDLAEESSELAEYLLNAWSRNTNGERFAFAPGVREELFYKLNKQVDLGDLRSTLDAQAREAFQSDFIGDVKNIDKSGVANRWEWLRTTFLELCETKLLPQEARLLWRAFDETFAASHAEVRPRPLRDHTYAPYVLPYNGTIRTFHEHLVTRIVAA